MLQTFTTAIRHPDRLHAPLAMRTSTPKLPGAVLATHGESAFVRNGLLAPALATLLLIGCRGPSAAPSTTPNAQVPVPTLGGGVRARASHAGDDGEPTLSATPTIAPSVSAESPLEHWIALALAGNPGLAASFDEVLSAHERVPQAQALPDPRLSFKHFLEPVETRVGPQRQAIGLSQVLPFWGKRDLRGQRAEALAAARAQRWEAERLELVTEVTAVWAECHDLARSLEVVERTLALVTHLEQVARTRYAAAGGSHADVIRAQLELGRVEDRLASLRDRGSPLQARMAALVGAPVPLPRPPALLATLSMPTLEAASEHARRHNPELRALDLEVVATARAKDLADKEPWPDISVGVDYIRTGGARGTGVSGSGHDPLAVGVSLTLPVQWSRLKALERESSAQHRAATRRRDELRLDITARVAGAHYRWRDAERQVDLYRITLVPRARQATAATETAYRTGDATFGELVDAERVLLELELAAERAAADTLRARAALQALTGGPVPLGDAASATGHDANHRATPVEEQP